MHAGRVGFKSPGLLKEIPSCEQKQRLALSKAFSKRRPLTFMIWQEQSLIKKHLTVVFPIMIPYRAISCKQVGVAQIKSLAADIRKCWKRKCCLCGKNMSFKEFNVCFFKVSVTWQESR